MNINQKKFADITHILTKKITHLLVIFTITAGMTFLSCAKEKEDSLSGTIEIAGSSTVFPITAAMAEEFLAEYPELDIPIRSTGTGGGFSNFFVTGKTDINNASRHIKSAELKLAKSNGIEPIEFQVATDAITIVVNTNFPLNNISTNELNAIWAANSTATKWSDIDSTWPHTSLDLYGPSSASGTFDYFTDVINGEEGSSRTDYQKTEQDNTIIQAVEGSETALGYLGLAYYLENKEAVKALSVNGIKPSIETARNGTYTPLSRPIFIYVSSKSLARPEVQAFIRFYIETSSSDLVSDVGYVPLTEEIVQENLKKLDAAITAIK